MLLGQVCRVCHDILSSVGLHSVYPLCRFFLLFLGSFGSYGVPRIHFFPRSQFADFVLGSKFGFFTKISQDTGIGCNLKGTFLETICTLF